MRFVYYMPWPADDFWAMLDLDANGHDLRAGDPAAVRDGLLKWVLTHALCEWSA